MTRQRTVALSIFAAVFLLLAAGWVILAWREGTLPFLRARSLSTAQDQPLEPLSTTQLSTEEITETAKLIGDVFNIPEP